MWNKTNIRLVVSHSSSYSLGKILIASNDIPLYNEANENPSRDSIDKNYFIVSYTLRELLPQNDTFKRNGSMKRVFFSRNFIASNLSLPTKNIIFVSTSKILLTITWNIATDPSPTYLNGHLPCPNNIYKQGFFLRTRKVANVLLNILLNSNVSPSPHAESI